MRFCMYPCKLVFVLMIAALLPGPSCSPAEPNAQATCGDGITEGSEECDNGIAMNSDTVPNSCRTTCQWYFCGDGVIDVGEECDDGNNVSGDGCSDLCVHQLLCGDGLVEGGEQCDDGNTVSGDGCSSGCVLEWVCGDGVCETDRQENCPACPEDCCPCGDGTCDQAMGETCSICQDDCCPDCGDGLLDPTEQCDDGNNTDNDGCSAGCVDEDGTPTCGNGIWEAGEGCEDGNTTAGDGCSDVCQVEYVCGDNLCEDTFGETCQICPMDCCPNCGNSALEPALGEECDGGDFGGLTCENSCYSGGTPTCTNYCSLDMSSCTGTLPVCGNDAIECGESCDGSDLGGNTCYTFGLDGGTLGCDSGCDYDTSGCGALLWYFSEDFEDPATHATWSFGTGEWEIGTIGPADNPPTAHGGTYAMATNLGGSYANSDRYDVDRAITPPINLTLAAAPALRFWMWNDTEFCCDGFAMFITINGGTTWTHLTGPTPAYNTTHGSYQCWQETSAFPAAWTQVDFDLTAYAGETIQLGFSFYSDGSVTYTGPHVDDILVAEPGAMP